MSSGAADSWRLARTALIAFSLSHALAVLGGVAGIAAACLRDEARGLVVIPSPIHQRILSGVVLGFAPAVLATFWIVRLRASWIRACIAVAVSVFTGFAAFVYSTYLRGLPTF